MADARRSERLEARVSPAEKELFVRAAELAGRSLTDFILANLHRAAEEIQREQHVILLSAADSSRFLTALVEPPEPTEALRRAAGRLRDSSKPTVPA